MILKRHKLTTPEITILGIIGAALVGLSSLTLRPAMVTDHDLLEKAAKKTAEAFAAIKAERIARNIPIDEIDDPSGSGLIGLPNSSITTNTGEIDAKQTTINPNWAAVIIRYLQAAGVKKGDNVAIGMTGSFPALDAATLVAIETYGAKPLWIVSEGSSSYGANIPEYTWLDMEAALTRQGVIHYHALAASLGGNNNIGGGLAPEGRDTLRAAIIRNNLRIIETTPLAASIDQGMHLFDSAAAGKPVTLYINVGGGLASLGTAQTGLILDHGLNPPKRLLDIENEPVQGYAALFMRRGLSVLNLLDIIPMAKVNSLPIAPVVTPDPGVGSLFVAPRYNVAIILVLLLTYASIVLAFAYGLTDAILRNPRKGEML